MNSQMDLWDDELGLYLDNNGPPPPACIDAGFIDWTATSGFGDGGWTGTTDEVPLYVDSGLSDAMMSPTTNGDIQHQHSAFPPDSFLESHVPSATPNDMPLSSADFTMMDTLWPVLPESGYSVEFWDLSLERDQSHFGYLPPVMPSSAPTYSNLLELEPCEAPRKRRRRIPPGAKRLLDECFEDHKADPYIPQEKMKELANRTGLSLRQVQTFFANARARKLPPIPTSPKGQTIKSSNRNIPGSTEEQQDPMQRFLSTSPEDEGISEEAIRDAANRTAQTNSSITGYRESKETDTISISDTTFSSNSGSGSSQASIDSTNSRGPRRGRKRQREPTQKGAEKVVRKPGNPLKKYQCTFCTSEFGQKFDWTRHEESVHFPQKEWICMPNGATHDTDDGLCCILCNELNPDEEHLEIHNSNACLLTSLSSRTFLRKDKLVQHLTQVHRCCQFPKRIQDWCVPIKRSVTLVCGLCGLILLDWHTRTAHISTHFQNGVGMDKWILDHPGGIVAHVNSSDQSIKSMCNIVLAPDGDFQCDVCPDRFNQLSHVICHYRQIHEIYSDEDRVLMHVVTWPSDLPQTTSRKSLTDMAQNSFGMKLFKQRNPAHKKSISQIKRLVVPLVKKNVNGKTGVDQPIILPTSVSTSVGVQTTPGISPHDLRTPGQQPNKIRLTPSKCNFKIMHDQQLENVTNAHNKPGINYTTQSSAFSHPIEHIPTGLMSQVDPKNPAGSTRPVPAYLRKTISMHYCASKPKVASLLSKQHPETLHPPTNSTTIDTIARKIIQPQRKSSHVSTLPAQLIPWPQPLHEMHRFPIPANHIPSFNSRPRRATRLSNVSLASPHPTSETENDMWMPGPQQHALHMESVADTAAVDSYADSNPDSAQHKCWDGQTRLRIARRE